MEMRSEKGKCGLFCLLCFLFMPVLVSANMVWPSLYIAQGLRSWYVILLGLAIEGIFVKCFLKQGYLKSGLIAFVMNVVSTVLGIAVIPISGFVGEILMIPFGTATFHLSHWVMSYLFAILSNVLLEGLTVKIIFKHPFKQMFWWLCLANSISILICILFHGFEMQNIMI